MYKTIPEALQYASDFKEICRGINDRNILICSPFTIIQPLTKALKGSGIYTGAQNMYYENEGAFTGEISPKQLIDAGARYVILGHSERRHIFGEKDELINKKVLSAIKSGLLPILCVGELLEEREKGKTEAVLKLQITEGFRNINKDDALKVTIAYEPVWAIGTGRTATPEDADNVHAFIRKILRGIYDSDFAQKVIIQYGGSVKPDNIDALMSKENIDGVLVGGASLKPDSFARIVKFK
jgi:triosephosphate isomerase